MASNKSKVKHKRKVPFIEQMQQSECGLCSLAMVLSYYYCHVDLTELRKKAGEGRNGTSLLTLKKLAMDYHLDSRGQAVPLNLLHDIPLPAIVFWNQKHYVVLEEINDKLAVIVDPELGRLKLDINEFEKKYSGILLALTPSKKFKQKRINRKEKYSYFNSFLNEKKVLYKILSVALFLQLLTVSIPLLLKYLIDDVLKSYNIELINVIGLVGLLTLFIYLGFTIIHGKLLIKLQNIIDKSLMNRFIFHLFKLPYNFFELRTSGDLILRANSNVAIRQIVSNQLVSSIINFLLIIVLFIYMFLQSIQLTLIVSTIAFLQVIVTLSTRSRLKHLTQLEVSSQSSTNGYLTETVQGISIIKSLGVENQVYKGWSALFNKQIAASTDKLNYQNVISAFNNSLMFISPLFVAWTGAILVMQKEITLGTLFAFQSLVVTFLTPFTSLTMSFSEIIKIQALLERIHDILGTKTEGNENKEKINDIKGNISLQDVSFCYSNQEQVLDNINLEVLAGQKVAIIGKTGSGKSTLASLVAGLYEPTTGSVKFDNKDISNINKSDLRRRIGIVMQEDFLFNRTIKENIRMYHENITSEQIEKASKLTAIHDEISRMPMKYETIVSEMGSNISGGQKQRIVLARALVNNPSILILDEATSALDTITEQKISDNLDQLKCTRIIIAHRLSTVVSADVIVLMDKGKIIDYGTHEELLIKSPSYQSFYNIKKLEISV